MNPRATDLKQALRLSVFSIVWSGMAGTVAVYAALVSGSLSLLVIAIGSRGFARIP